MEKYLKKVSNYDCDLLFKWANDEKVRLNSFNENKIKYDEHVKWFKSKLCSNNCWMFIFYIKENPIGQVRIDIEKSVGYISYSVDNKFRGNGYGIEILNLLERKIMECKMGINILIGKVKYSNIASQKIFTKSKYEKVEKQDYIQFTKVFKNSY